MCGFVAIIGRNGFPTNRPELKRATETLRHRGPDDSGFFNDESVGLGFRRLSILDLSMQSHQPFEDAEGRFVLVFNGEIYNYIELRQELQKKGHTFRSTGDAEVLLSSYIEWGESCLNRFNGMWAFIIYDRKDGVCFGSRDRFGVKPLFMCDDGSRHIFASEIKAIVVTDNVDSRVNWRIASQYLIDGRLSAPDHRLETMYEGIFEVGSGHAFRIDLNGNFRSWQYWSLPTSQSFSGDTVVSEFDHIFKDSVNLRMRSDVPVGVCLSGGLDSTAVICHMARILGDSRTEPLHAFSYFDENFDETAQISATIQETNAELHRLTSSEYDFLEKLDEVMWFHDEPLHSLNALISYELYGMAAKSGVKVILNGQGADETWAGYPSYFPNHWYGLLQAGNLRRLRSEIKNFGAAHNVDEQALLKETIIRFIKNQFRRSKLYRSLANFRDRPTGPSGRWFSSDLSSRLDKDRPEFESLDLDTNLEKSVVREPLPLYLRVEDRNSMAHSVETRLPFLDYRLVTLAFNTSPDWKMRGALNKFALREAMDGVIPEVVRTRVDKMGFPSSEREWFAGPLYGVVRDIIGSSSARQNGIYKVDEILRDLERHRKGEVDFSEDLLRVTQFQIFAERWGTT